MNLVKINENGNVVIDNELWLFNEFNALKTSKYLTEKGNLDGRKSLPANRTSLIPKHLRALKYMYLLHHPKMKQTYEYLSDNDREELASLDSNFIVDAKDKIYQEAEKRFINMCSSLELLALDSCRTVVHTIIKANTTVNSKLQKFYLDDNDEQELDSVLKKSSIVMDNVNKLDKLLNTLNTLKDRYRKQFASEDAIRGDQEEGLENDAI